MHHGQIRRNSNARVNIRSIALAALIGMAGCSSPGLIPGGRPLDRTALRVLAEDAAFRTGLSARLIRAVVSVESDGDPAAISRAGATGLMQLMPGTARDVAGKLGVPYIQDKLTRDPGYNVQLGTQYLGDMLHRFGGSYELALAAYNAGPARVARWLESMGDPRAGKMDMVDWIEMIPYRETRNYVQRIMEGVGVYRDRLSGPFTLQQPGMGRS